MCMCILAGYDLMTLQKLLPIPTTAGFLAVFGASDGAELYRRYQRSSGDTDAGEDGTAAEEKGDKFESNMLQLLGQLVEKGGQQAAVDGAAAAKDLIHVTFKYPDGTGDFKHKPCHAPKDQTLREAAGRALGTKVQPDMLSDALWTIPSTDISPGPDGKDGILEITPETAKDLRMSTFEADCYRRRTLTMKPAKK